MTADAAAVARWLDAALAHAGRSHRLEDVARMLATGEARLWVGSAAALVTLVQDEPCERRLLIWLGGGDLREIVDELVPRVEAWARGAGVRRALIIGREGWERALRPAGYAPAARIVAKELT